MAIMRVRDNDGNYIDIPALNGESAYNIAVKNGFTGTETEWLNSLNGEKGASGTNGATFMPSVSSEGVLSWENDKGLDNPEAINIKGDKGDSPVRGIDYWTAADIAEIKAYVDNAVLGGEW